ncbi:MAG TPA: ABC transporter ATP-binding protein, partial [Thauera aminoaromatica]|nr:ABC transporter ATP-binding protein [Thauera aminoaromatica]
MLAGLIHAERPDELRRGLRWLYGFVRPQRRRIAGLLLLSCAATLLVLLQPWLTKLLIDEGLLARDYRTLLMVAGAMIAVGIVGTVLAGVNRQLHTRLSGSI